MRPEATGRRSDPLAQCFFHAQLVSAVSRSGNGGGVFGEEMTAILAVEGAGGAREKDRFWFEPGLRRPPCGPAAPAVESKPTIQAQVPPPGWLRFLYRHTRTRPRRLPARWLPSQMPQRHFPVPPTTRPVSCHEKCSGVDCHSCACGKRWRNARRKCEPNNPPPPITQSNMEVIARVAHRGWGAT